MSDFFPDSPFLNTKPSNEFGVDEFRSFNDKCLFTDNAVGVEFQEGDVNGDISFYDVSQGYMGRETGWRHAHHPVKRRRPGFAVRISGRDGLGDGNAGLHELPSLWCLGHTMSHMQRLGLVCRRVSENIPFAWIQSTALTSMKVTAGCVDPGFNFPQPRQDGAEGRWPFFDDETFTPLTRLESLDI